MSREILFRGKRVEGGKWIYGYLSFFYIDNPGKGRIFSPKEVRSFDVISETVGQYTGLKDKNETKIFEGDILEGDLNDNLDPGAKWRSEVVWGKFGWMCKARQTLPMDENDIREGEIIGNIYDNPELMEDKENE